VSPVPFETTSTEVDGIRVIAIRGELDLGTAPALEGPLEETVGNGDSPVMIDLTECEFIDSTGIAMIVRAWQKVDSSESDSSLVICGQNEQVHRVLEISGLSLSIPTHGDRSSGLEALRDGASGSPA
jgi:anti-anti-sigma factor